jgi:uncharacterized protein involved in exopolysaccharide biosynthesis
MAVTPTKTTPRDLLRVVFRRRLLFLTGAGLFALAALIGACWYPLKYTGTALFERRSDMASQGTAGGNFEPQKLTLEIDLIGDNALHAAIDEIEKDNAEKVKLGKEKPIQLPAMPRTADGKLTTEGQMARQELVRAWKADLRVNFEVRSSTVDMVSVAFTSRDPKLAQDLPNTLMSKYIDRMSFQIEDELKKTRDYFQGKLEEADKSLHAARDKKFLFEKNNAGKMPELPGITVQQLDRVGQDIEAVTRQRDYTQRKLSQWNDMKKEFGAVGEGQTVAPVVKPTGTDAAPETGDKAASADINERPPDRVIKGPNPEITRLKEELHAMKKKLEDARINMKEEHPVVKQLTKQIAEIEERIAKEPEIVPLQYVWDPPRQPPSAPVVDPTGGRDRKFQAAWIDGEIATAKEELDRQQKDLDKLHLRQASLTDLINNFETVRREYDDIIKNLAKAETAANEFQHNLTETENQFAAEIAKHGTHLDAVTRAQEQYVPSSPNLVYVLAFAILGGLAFGGGMVFLANMMDRSISTTEEAAEYFDLPVYGVVGEIVTPRQRALRKIRRLVVGPLATLVVLAALGLASLNIVLWLRYHTVYEDWRKNPTSFISNQVSAMVESLKNHM